MALIKDIYSKPFYRNLAKELNSSGITVDEDAFITTMMPPAFEKMEWKERLKHTTTQLHAFLPNSYKLAIGQILKLTQHVENTNTDRNRLAYLFLADYVSTYGLHDIKTSCKAMERITQLISCEFAVRPFIALHPDYMIPQIIAWGNHKHHAVRRLASEGSRPRLPWGAAITAFKKDPSSMIPLLNQLKDDPHEWVRLSVANHLNDISKDNPNIALQLAKTWFGKSNNVDAVVKHGLRTLLKKGDKEALALFSLDAALCDVSALRIKNKTIEVGEYLEFEFNVTHSSPQPLTIRLEYAIYYQKAKGHLTKKVYKISEKKYAPATIHKTTRRQSFKPITTRVFHAGKHQLSIVINGKETAPVNFTLNT